MVKITCQLNDYSEPHKATLRVHNHWNSDRLIEIEIEEKRYTVSGNDMIEAIKNCMNTNRYGR